MTEIAQQVVDAEIVESDSTQEWANTISGEWRKSVDGILLTGKALINAKADLDHGEFGRMFCSTTCRDSNHEGADHVGDPVPFSIGTGQRLMAIANHVALSDAAYTPHLPPTWMTLSHLAKVPAPALVAHIERGDVHPELQQGDAYKLWREHREKEPKKAAPATPADLVDDSKKLYYGDFREVLTSAIVPDHSVDLILTDPPYARADLDLYGDLALVASRVLKKSGVVLAYAGTMFIPEVVEQMSKHLTYAWTFCLLMPEGAQSRINSRHVIQEWKPIFCFVKGSYSARGWESDVVTNPKRQKELHPWQQGIAPAVRLIRRFTSPKEVVLDPFLGSGTTGVAALDTKRRFIGCESNPAAFEKAKSRIEELGTT